jgi:hypothetical protein
MLIRTIHHPFLTGHFQLIKKTNTNVLLLVLIFFVFYFTIFVAIKPFLRVLLCIHIILQAKNTKKS